MVILIFLVNQISSFSLTSCCCFPHLSTLININRIMKMFFGAWFQISHNENGYENEFKGLNYAESDCFVAERGWKCIKKEALGESKEQNSTKKNLRYVISNECKANCLLFSENSHTIIFYDALCVLWFSITVIFIWKHSISNTRKFYKISIFFLLTE